MSAGHPGPWCDECHAPHGPIEHYAIMDREGRLDAPSPTLATPWCEECEASHDAEHHGKILAAKAEREAVVKEKERRQRVVALARDLFVGLAYNDREQALTDAVWALTVAETFDKATTGYLTAPMPVAPAGENAPKEKP